MSLERAFIFSSHDWASLLVPDYSDRICSFPPAPDAGISYFRRAFPCWAQSSWLLRASSSHCFFCLPVSVSSSSSPYLISLPDQSCLLLIFFFLFSPLINTLQAAVQHYTTLYTCIRPQAGFLPSLPSYPAVLSTGLHQAVTFSHLRSAFRHQQNQQKSIPALCASAKPHPAQRRQLQEMFLSSHRTSLPGLNVLQH